MNPLVIEDREFRLEQCEIGSPFWDMYVQKIVKHKDGSSTKEWKIMYYGVSITHAIESIIQCRMAARKAISEDKTPFLLKDYFIAYKNERLETLKAFNLVTIDLTKDLINLQKQLKNGN